MSCATFVSDPAVHAKLVGVALGLVLLLGGIVRRAWLTRNVQPVKTDESGNQNIGPLVRSQDSAPGRGGDPPGYFRDNPGRVWQLGSLGLAGLGGVILLIDNGLVGEVVVGIGMAGFILWGGRYDRKHGWPPWPFWRDSDDKERE